MSVVTLSSRELNQDVSRAKKAAQSGPVFITDRGKPAHVLLSFSEHQRLTQQRRNIADALSMPVGAVATRNVADFAATGVEIINP